MKKFLILMQLFFSTAFFASAQVQTEISQDELARIYEEVKTPYKYGMVIAPQDNGHKIDCPTVFREGDSWYMTYVVYNGKTGQDGRGYETWLAKSSCIGKLWDAYLLIVTESGTVISAEVSPHLPIWSGEVPINYSNIKAVIG